MKSSYPTSIESANASVQANPTAARAYYDRAQAYFNFHYQDDKELEKCHLQRITDYRLAQIFSLPNPEGLKLKSIASRSLAGLYHSQKHIEGYLTEAIEHYNTVISFEEQNNVGKVDRTSYYRRGEAYRKRCNLTSAEGIADLLQAIKDYATAGEKFPHSYDVTDLERLKESFDAKRKVELSSVVLTPNSLEELKPETLLEQADDFNTQKNYAEAIKLCNKALELEPLSQKAYHIRGTSYTGQSQWAKAMVDFQVQQALHNLYPHLDPEIAKKQVSVNRINLGMLYTKLKLYGEALKCFNENLVENPNCALNLFYRGKAHLENRLFIRKIPQALEDLKKAILLFNNKDGTHDALIVFQKALVFGKGVKDKKEIFNKIKEIKPLEAQVKLLQDCLEQTTIIGQLFWTQSGVNPCSLEKGSLKKINKHLQEITHQLNTSAKRQEMKSSTAFSIRAPESASSSIPFFKSKNLQNKPLTIHICIPPIANEITDKDLGGPPSPAKTSGNM